MSSEFSTAVRLPSVRRLLLLLVLGCVLPGVIGAALLFSYLSIEADRQLQQSTMATARTLVREVDAQFAQARLLAVTLAQSRTLAGDDLAAFHREARQLLSATAISTGVVVSDVQGQQVLDTRVAFGTPLLRYGNQNQLRQVITSGRAVASDVFADLPAGHYAVAFPVMVNGNVIRVVSVLMSLRQLDALLQRYPFPAGWTVSIVDSSGTIAARNRLAEQFVGQKASLEMFLVESEGIHHTYTSDSIAVRTFFSTSAASHWRAVIGSPGGPLPTFSVLTVTLTGSALLAWCVLAGAMALTLGRRITWSMTALALPARDLAAGKPLVLPRVYFHEAGEVARVTIRSSMELRYSELALKALNRDLEARIQERTREATDLYDRAPCSYHTLDAAGIVIQVNQTGLDLLGYHREEYLGHAIRQFMTPDSWATIADRYPQLLPGGQLHELEVDFVHKDGTVVPCLMSANAELDSRGNFAFLRSTLVDNRIGKARQQQIISLNQFLNDVLESLPFGVAVLNEQQQVILRNRLFGDLQSYPPELFQKSPRLFTDMVRFSYELGYYPQRLYDDVLADYRAMIASRQSVCMERSLPDNKYLEIRGQPISADWVLLTYTDITPFRLAEQALSQARTEAETANLAKSDFLANMTHELRTPLNAVIGLARLLTESPLNAWQRDYADKIALSAQSLQVLINDILDLSKMEANQLRIEQIPFSLNLLLRTAASVLGVGVGQKEIAVVLDLAPDVPDAMVGDPLRVQQILLNLISNALKFTERGEIVVSVRCQSVAPVPAGAPVLLQIAVRDTGIGIAAAGLESIFNAFMQADASTTRLYGGTGLGLTISNRLVTMMGGQISVDSTPGQGSEFRFSLPLTAGVPVRQDDFPAALRVLIVESHPLKRVLLRDACLAFGWQVRVIDPAQPGLPALLKAGATRGETDLLLLDGRLPEIDTMALLRQWRAMPDVVLPRTLLMVPLLALDRFAAGSRDGYPGGLVAKPLTRWSLAEAVLRLFPVEPAACMPAAATAALPLSGLRLLVAEDNAINQEVAAQVLTAAGAEVVVVGDGIAVQAALTMAADRFDIVLMDIQMPLMDGYAATRWIRDHSDVATLPVIALTAQANAGGSATARDAGMTGVLAKPLDIDALLAVIAGAGIGWPAGSHRALPDAPPAIPLSGLDFVAALKVFGGDKVRLATLLRAFVGRQGGDVAEARRLLDCNDIDAAIDLVHQIRGVAASLHARELHHVAGLTEAALLDGAVEALPDLFSQLQDAMTMVRHCARRFDALLTLGHPGLITPP
ncbi:ATP-binding protein [Actimicrobium sp. CCC2.4]|uniref:ATP-binding protein n=1 Tax=Actimicrobium sp. CCC2.4 TaxID=3048606 RepID=UPI002AC8F4A4|nr:ATP-binding protein [Actimicrobium sp. CCC2.4]MEB0135390.1 ATP-binding protein [Actimicrobium sp. CCC2.4]WPX32435.1 ATP-binding protein [Actimicrobium sp. CCC2.4]